MITDVLLELALGLLEWLGDVWEGIVPEFDLDGLEASWGWAETGASFLANFVHLPTVGGVIAFILIWEGAYVSLKLLIKLYRLVPGI